MSAALIAKLIEAGTPAALVGEVAMALAKAEAAAEILETRRRHERERKAKSRDVTGQNVTERDSADNPPALDKEKSPRPPKEIKPTAPMSAKPAPAWALPAGVSFQVWEDLKANRRRKRLPNTPTAWEQFQRDVDRVSAQTGIPPPELIRRCVAKGWGAIYDPRDNENERTNSMGRNKSSDGLSSTARAAIAVFGSSQQ